MKKPNYIINKSIKQRLCFYFITLSVIPLLLLQLITASVSNNTISNMITKTTTAEVKTILTEMERSFSNMKEICDSVNNNASFQQRMRTQYTTIEEQFSEDLNGNLELNSIVSGRKDISGIYVLGLNNICCKSNTASFQKTVYREDYWFDAVLNSGSDIWYGIHDESFVVKSSGTRYISLCSPYIDKSTGKINGVIVVELAENTLLDTITQYEPTDVRFTLLDNKCQILYSSDEFTLPSKLLTTLSYSTSGDNSATSIYPSAELIKRELFVYQKSATTNWSLIGNVPKNYLNSINIKIFVISAVILLVVAAIAIFLSSFLSRKFTDPIIHMKNAMKSVEDGDFSVQITAESQDELASLAHSFNHMVTHIQDLMNSIYEQQVRLRKSEFKALQAQINPHFLYNSLDSIVWLLKMNRNADSIHMLQNLAMLFRIALSKGSELIPIASEIQHITSYLEIQTIRYSRKFDYDIDFPENLKSYSTLKLLLQPLVENSIYHGLSKTKPHVHIHVEIMEDIDDIFFIVQDNGIGMTAEELSRLRTNIYSNTEIHSSGYGLHNINERIQTYFGDNYGLSIESEFNYGTTVKLKLPKQIHNADTGSMYSHSSQPIHSQTP